MDSRSNNYLKEAVFAVLKGHLTLEFASEKYAIAPDIIKEGIKNYCMTGKVTAVRGSFAFMNFYIKYLRLNLRNAFSKIAPTYDHEKEIDRFKFKFAYAVVSFLVVALGITIMSFPNVFFPSDMNAQSFEDKMNQALLTTSRRPATIDAEVKYLNRFYTRINKILEKSDSNDSKMLKAEIEGRLAYISKIDQKDIAKRSVNFTDQSAAGDKKASVEMYKRMYSTASAKDANTELARTLKDRIEAENSRIPRANYAPKIAAAPAPALATSPVTTAAAVKPVPAEQLKPAIEEPAAEAVKPAAPLQTAAPAETKSFKYAKASYESVKDRMFIINRYKRETLVKKMIAQPKLKYKYPLASLIPVYDKKKYDQSLKKIATNPKPERQVKIVEDRG